MIKILPPIITEQPNFYKVPPREPIQIGEYGFWQDGDTLKCYPIYEPTACYGGVVALEKLFTCLKEEANGQRFGNDF